SGTGFKYKPWKYQRIRKINEYIINETAIKTSSSELSWLWVIIKPKYKAILAVDISKEQNMFVTQSDFCLKP
ncbi:MAG TPA: hypothetical protein VN704_03770, partial [Verrucomicrobiae bacterium]|nr:hypothetical protein [Verrucomicrobiae bacterium]